MKRLHVHVHVQDLEKSVDYYRRMFGTEPDKREADYARWRMDEPAVNFAISTACGCGDEKGVSHLGLDFDDGTDLVAFRDRMADAPRHDEAGTSCCYARSDKAWFTDPDGVSWEAFHTFGTSRTLENQNRRSFASQSDRVG